MRLLNKHQVNKILTTRFLEGGIVVKEKSTKTSKTNWAKLKNMDNTEIDYSDTPECIVIY